MNRVIYFVLIFILLGISCKKEEKFVEPDHLLRRWGAAAKDLNYTDYSRIEAYPKEPGVFRETFRDYYPSDISVSFIEDDDPGRIFTDHKGMKYVRRNVAFSFVQVNRKTKSSLGYVTGDVDFVNYIDGPLKTRGWIMLNRTLIHINK
jgi:hypothetical protein